MTDVFRGVGFKPSGGGFVTTKSRGILLVAMAGLLIGGHADAVELSKCMSKTGQTTYTDGPCPDAAAKSAAGNFKRDEPPRAAPVQANDGAYNPDLQGSPTTREVYPNISSSEPAPVPSGYRCQAGDRSWVQTQPCPSTSERTVKERVHISSWDATGPATITRKETVPVEQQQLSRGQLCDEMKRRAAESGMSKRSAPDAYERNKLRLANGCS